MLLIIADALDSTPTHNSTPGDNIFKRQNIVTLSQNVITGVCFLPCYTVRRWCYLGGGRVLEWVVLKDITVYTSPRPSIQQ